MKFTTWRTWLWNSLGRFLRPRRPRTLATATCLALGLTTAWGGEAEADITFKVEVTPAHDLMDAFVYFGNNATGGIVRSLGPLEANSTHSFIYRFDEDGYWSDLATPEYYQHSGRFEVGFALGGLYERGDDFGITLSFPNNDAEANQTSWDSLFDFPTHAIRNYGEQDIVARYLNALGSPFDPWYSSEVANNYYTYTSLYGDHSDPDNFRDSQYVTPYGTEATLISFRDTRFAGTAIVSIVPEPQSVFYVVAFAGMALADEYNELHILADLALEPTRPIPTTPAKADITFKVEVTPAHDLLDAFVYFGNNATGANAYPLGPLSANESHSYLLQLPGTSGFYLDDTPEYYKPGGRVPIGFGIGGIYELNEAYGIAISFVDSSPIDTQQTWEEFFDFEIGGYPNVTEADIVEDYFAELEHAPLKLSAAIIARNEESAIARAIESVQPVVDEIVVADTGSDDQTIHIANSLGCRVEHFAWCDDFSAAYNYCIEKARGEWILQIDADEELLPASCDAVRGCIANPTALAYTVLRRDLYGPESDSYTKMWHVRLFRNRPDLRFVGRIHHKFITPIESIEKQSGLQLSQSKIELLHHGYAGGDQQAKLTRAARLMELELEDRPGQFYYLVELGRTYLKLRDERGVALIAESARLVRERPQEALANRSLLATLLEHILAAQTLPAGFPLSHDDAARLALEYFPSAVPLLWQLALRAYQSGDFARSAGLLERVIQLGESERYDKGYSFQPDIMRGDAVLNLGVCYANLGRLQPARRCFRQLLRVEKYRSRAERNLKLLGG
ncbi:TPR repeat-containing protein Synpcc7942_0270 [Durusdinium trenchii]|uniref:TPR repeat-containing protein Synpcc7942_0270 n=1 Tax=Durusdinium trenchii TaxID=1381693 RepID=A0ABP0LE96_9DINO